jgi:hypothetical protein
MAGKTSIKWTGEAHTALAAALARMIGSITPEMQEQIVQYMKESGFETSWEGIR